MVSIPTNYSVESLEALTKQKSKPANGHSRHQSMLSGSSNPNLQQNEAATTLNLKPNNSKEVRGVTNKKRSEANFEAIKNQVEADAGKAISRRNAVVTGTKDADGSAKKSPP